METPAGGGTQDEILTPKEAALVLRMSEQWLRQSDCPRVMFGRRVRYLRSQLLAFAEARLSHRVEPSRQSA